MSIYKNKPRRFLERLHFQDGGNPIDGICCAGFELKAWRCVPFAEHLIEWLPEYALPEDELAVNHGNMYVKLKKAAVRVYTSEKYKKRGEAGEVALHAICRDYFDTLPISNRVFYKSASNDVVKAFDMVHARFPTGGGVELWLGESKLYQDTLEAIATALKSVAEHLEQGFLKEQKLLLGPQIPKTTPRYDEILELFEPQTSLDKFIASGVFVIGILSDSKACRGATEFSDAYKAALMAEFAAIRDRLAKSGLTKSIRVVLLYVPLADKNTFVATFDAKLKGLQ
ncbi:HamA C-terminal domain-containing protein [Xanthobacter sediminis]|uniref:HamA C-terminal domain-containing protein n=1 Tax=Xanthobacter sediminis TaxID=3119926 RepID=UPI00372A0E6E